MTVSPDARTPSAPVHALSGSSAGPGRPFAPVATVHELPDPFVPLGDAAAGCDAELFALLDCWHEITAARPAMEATLDAAMDRARAAYPTRPATLNATIFDHCTRFDVMPHGAEKMPNGGFRCFWEQGDVEKLRVGPPPMHFAAVADDHVGPVPEVIDPRGEARRREIIAAHDEWVAAREAVEDAVGLTAANAAWEAQIAALNAAEDAVKLCPPRILAGLARKAARVADLLARDAADDDLAEVFARQVAAFAGQDAAREPAALGVASDLASAA